MAADCLLLAFMIFTAKASRNLFLLSLLAGIRALRVSSNLASFHSVLAAMLLFRTGQDTITTYSARTYILFHNYQ